MVPDQSQGVQLSRLQGLLRYWGTDYDWRRAEARLNALPQFVTEIDGLDIHFLHVRSRHSDALPLIVTHGWPGSILELPLFKPRQSHLRAGAVCLRPIFLTDWALFLAGPTRWSMVHLPDVTSFPGDDSDYHSRYGPDCG